MSKIEKLLYATLGVTIVNLGLTIYNTVRPNKVAVSGTEPETSQKAAGKDGQ